MSDQVPPTLAGRYELGDLIGRGGMAEVHIGRDLRLGRTVAIKILRADLAHDPVFLARFRREAQAAASLNHPSIVAVYDTGEEISHDEHGREEHVPYIVMEYVEGHTVRDILQNEKALPVSEAVEIATGVLSALEYSHRAGIIHRDIKPGNIMITPAGQVKVMDFGIARAIADSAATMTQSQAVVGTAQYLSPEQARGETVDARSDLYSTGCLLFEMLTGRPPFVGDSPVSIAYQHVREIAPAPSSIVPTLPKAYDRIIAKALAKDRDDRYSTAAEFRADLEAARSGGQVGAAEETRATQVLAAAPPADATQVLTPPSWDPAASTGAGALSPDGYFDAEPEQGRPRKKRMSGGKRALIVVLVLALLAALGFGVWWQYFRDQAPAAPTEVAVPSLADGVTPERAQSAIEAAGLRYQQEQDNNSEESEGTFTRQDPRGGATVAPGSTVHVYFSTGPNTVQVPDLANQTQSAARSSLEALGLTIGDLHIEDSPDVPKDNITRTDPQAGASAKRGDVIQLYISNGMVTVPDLKGKSKNDAQSTLTDLRLSADWSTRETNDQPRDTVVSQSPAAGSVPQGSRIEIVTAVPEPSPSPSPTSASPSVSPSSVEVPDVEDLSVDDAVRQLREAGLDTRTETDPTDTDHGTNVIRTEPSAGSTVDPGTPVTIYYGIGSGQGNGNG